jgi:hypothetical protein
LNRASHSVSFRTSFCAARQLGRFRACAASVGRFDKGGRRAPDGRTPPRKYLAWPEVAACWCVAYGFYFFLALISGLFSSTARTGQQWLAILLAPAVIATFQVLLTAPYWKAPWHRD